MMDFDEDHPLFANIMAGMERHSDMRDPPPRDWVAPGYMAHGEVTAFFGKPDQTKSLIAIDIACRLAAGIGWDGEPAEYRQDVLYIATERPNQVRRRVTAFCVEHGIEALDNLYIYTGPIDMAADGPNQLEAIIRATSWLVHDEHLSIVFIDTLQHAMSKPVSDTSATAAVSRNMVSAAKECSAAIAFVHHTPLDDDSRMSGGHLFATVDVAVRVSKSSAGGTALVVKDNGKKGSEEHRLDYTIKSVDFPTRWGIESEGVVIPAEQRHGLVIAPPRLTRDRQMAVDALKAASEASGGAVSEAIWRNEFKARAGDRTPDALKVGFRRCKEWLEAGGHLIRDGNLFLLPGEQTEQGTK